MLTLFCIPKPFRGHIGMIQRNAIQSWTQLRPRCEVILFGDEEGTEDIAVEFGLRHVAIVARNSFGTPLVSDVFAQGQRLASFSILCYLNADIVLVDDFLASVGAIVGHRPSFLLVGRRWDLEVNGGIDFQVGWEKALKGMVRRAGTLHPHTGIDYFVFPQGVWGTIPPFAIGRTAWDGWLIYAARLRKVPVIDATEVVTAIHQNHDYLDHTIGQIGIWGGREAEHNLALAGGYRNAFTLRDATHRLTSRGLKSRLFPCDLRRSLLTPITTHPSLRRFGRWAKRSKKEQLP